jgi:hypothetical protein
MPEPVEQLHLLVGIPAHLVVFGEILHELVDAGAELVGEVRRRGSDERVHVVPGRLRHEEKPNG